MPVARCSDKDFIGLVKKHGAAKAARRLGVATRNVQQRRNRLEKKHNAVIGRSNNPNRNGRPQAAKVPGRLHYNVADGVVLVGSDQHTWPGVTTTAMRAFEMFCRDMKPKLVIVNGDMLDGARISRHPPLGQWENTPSLVDEIEATRESLDRYRLAAKNTVAKDGFIWNCGNHDGRYEGRLQQVAPEYARIHGMHLKDHIGGFSPAWSTWINNDLVVTHRQKGGEHAASSNTKFGGKSMCTGHLHSLQVRPYTDYNGTRFGIDCGTLADTYGPQFQYLEDGFRNWRSGFAVFTFRGGRMMWPEIVSVIEEGKIDFRGEIIRA